MKTPFRHLAIAAALIAAQCYAGAASAQWLDAVKGQMEGAGKSSSTPGSATQSGSTQGGILQGLGNSLPLSSLSPASAGNAAGVLEFCMKNNYLAGGDAQAPERSADGQDRRRLHPEGQIGFGIPGRPPRPAQRQRRQIRRPERRRAERGTDPQGVRSGPQAREVVPVAGRPKISSRAARLNATTAGCSSRWSVVMA